VRFGLDGQWYEIDLSSKNAAKLRNVMSPYLESATRIPFRDGPGAGTAGARRRGSAGADRDQNRAIRAWARRKGLDVAPRGRIKQEIIDQFQREAAR
jgi:hypothetical protein